MWNCWTFSEDVPESLTCVLGPRKTEGSIMTAPRQRSLWFERKREPLHTFSGEGRTGGWELNYKVGESENEAISGQRRNALAESMWKRIEQRGSIIEAITVQCDSVPPYHLSHYGIRIWTWTLSEGDVKRLKGGRNFGPEPRWWEQHVLEPGGPLMALKLVRGATVSQLNKSECLEKCFGKKNKTKKKNDVEKGP